jgi:hypothetical protein
MAAGELLQSLPARNTLRPEDTPGIPGKANGGYTVNVVIGSDVDGNPQSIDRTINTDEVLTYEELIAFASEDVREIIEKYPEQFEKRGITLEALYNWNVEMAWAKDQFPAITEFLEANPLEE